MQKINVKTHNYVPSLIKEDDFLVIPAKTLSVFV